MLAYLNVFNLSLDSLESRIKYAFAHHVSGGFKSQQCQQLLTGLPLPESPHNINQGPHQKRKVAPQHTRNKFIGLKGPVICWYARRGFLFCLFVCFLLFNLGNPKINFGSTKMEILCH